MRSGIFQTGRRRLLRKRREKTVASQSGRVDTVKKKKQPGSKAMKRRFFSAILIALFMMRPAAAELVFRAADASIRPALTSGNLTKTGQQAAEFVRIPESGRYEVTVRARGNPDEGLWPRMCITVSGLSTEAIPVETQEYREFRQEVDIEAGVRLIGVMMLNEGPGLMKKRILYLDTIRVAPAGKDAAGKEGAPLEKGSLLTWRDEAKAREAAVLKTADEAIAKNRMSEASVIVRGSDGAPLAEAAVSARQERHDFLFGCNIAGWDQNGNMGKAIMYRKRFADLFNYATLCLYWPYFEKEKGAPDYAYADEIIAWCEEKGITVKGHPLLWVNEHGLPPWTEGIPEKEVLEKRVTDLMTRYAGRIAFWEVVNEPANCPGIALAQPHAWARKTDPGAKLVVNEFGQFYNGHPEFFAILKEAVDNGVPFDAIGIQAHAPADMAFPLGRVKNILDHYAALGKAIHITEFTPPSEGGEATGAVWRGFWTEAMQAEYAADFYRVCFAHPAVEAISWWDFTDLGAWVPKGGLLEENLRKKAAFGTLEKLLHEDWRTETSGATGENGIYSFQGFHGMYTVTVEHAGKKAETELHLEKGAENQLVISL
jgi:endo-1,4-beta-xylanase